jgi:CheY-like chemotaxis protein
LFDFTGRTILIVDDNTLNLEIAGRLLEKKHCDVMLAHDGKEAVALFSSSRLRSIDVILMDVRMPVMDGLEATRTIRSLDRGDAKTVPIIAMTANAFDEDRKETKASGMDDHIAKPFEPEKMFGVIARYLGMDQKA